MIKEIIADTIKKYKAKSEIDIEAIRKGEKDKRLTKYPNSNNQQVCEEEKKEKKKEIQEDDDNIVKKISLI